MGQQHTIGKVHTTRGHDKDTGFYTVQYHATKVVKFSHDKIILNHGGYKTFTTKTRMNQTSNEFNLGYRIYQKDYNWFIDYNGQTIPFDREEITLKRN